MHISKVKLPFYLPCEIKCALQNRMSTFIFFLGLRSGLLEKMGYQIRRERQWSKHRPRSEKVFQIHNDYKVAHDSFPNRFWPPKKIVCYFSHFAMRNACFYDYRYMMFYTHTWSQTHYIIKKSLKYYKTIDLQLKMMLYCFSSFYFFIFIF